MSLGDVDYANGEDDVDVEYAQDSLVCLYMHVVFLRRVSMSITSSDFPFFSSR